MPNERMKKMEFRKTPQTLRYPADGVRRLRIQCNIFQVCLKLGRTDEIVLSYEDTQYRRLNIRASEEEICLSDEAAPTLYGVFRMIELKRNKELIVEIPLGFRGDISVESAEETISMDFLDVCGDIAARSQSGRIDARGIAGNHIAFSSNAGLIHAGQILPHSSLEMKTRAGRIECTLGKHWRAYRIYSRAQQGVCNLPPVCGDGPILVEAATATGCIHIEGRWL